MRSPLPARKRRARQSRGYLLIEVMASGAILAVILGATISMVGIERAQVTRASHRAKAASLAQDLMQQLLADSGPTKAFTCSGAVVASNPTGTGFAGFERDYSCSEIAEAGTDVLAGSTVLGKLYELKVMVRYPSGDRSNPVAFIEQYAVRRDRIL